jgi:EpsI family protein
MWNVRYAVIIGTLLVGWGLSEWIRSGYTRDSIIPPARTPETLPVSLLGYTGTEIDPDPNQWGRLQPESQIDRRYLRPTGEKVDLHAIWTSDYVKLHFPEQCYRESGWTETNRQQISLTIPGREPVPANLLTFEQGGQRIQVLYWLQLGDRIILSRGEHRLALQAECWGKKEWPPLVKVMLTSPAANPVLAQERLEKMGAEVYKWVNGMDLLSTPGGR